MVEERKNVEIGNIPSTSTTGLETLVPRRKRRRLLWRKLPMAWGVKQQTKKPHKSIPSQYAREIKHLTLKDLESYLFQMVEVDTH